MPRAEDPATYHGEKRCWESRRGMRFQLIQIGDLSESEMLIKQRSSRAGKYQSLKTFPIKKGETEKTMETGGHKRNFALSKEVLEKFFRNSFE